MKSRLLTRFSILIVVPVAVTFFAFAIIAPAHATSNIPNAGAPITHIQHGSQGPVFNPNSIQIFLQHTNVIEVINSTKGTKIVLNSSNQVVLTLAPSASGNLHFTSTGTFVFHLKGHPMSTFTAIVS